MSVGMLNHKQHTFFPPCLFTLYVSCGGGFVKEQLYRWTVQQREGSLYLQG